MANNKFKWPLQVDSHTIWDKLKISAFILSGARLTQGEMVKKYEETWNNFIGSNYSVMVSSGSTANILISMWHKHKLGERFKEKNEVLVPAVTWPTSINNWLMLGYKPVFFDVSLKNFGLDYDLVKEYVEKNHKKIACIFPTSLIGMTFDTRLIDLAKRYEIEIAQDNCEASFNYIEHSFVYSDKFGPKSIDRYKCYISSLTTSSTSSYIGHYASSIEGGIITAKSEEEYRFYIMNRNHGMVRSLIPYRNKLTCYNGMNPPDENYWESLYNQECDPQFDFAQLGNNFRSTDLNAKFGLLDSKRWNKYIEHRKNIGEIWSKNISCEMPEDFNTQGNVPFSLPIWAKNKEQINKIKVFLNEEGVEYRPLVAGNLTIQTCYKDLGYKNAFKNATNLHENCMYVGIPNDLNENFVEEVAKKLKHLL
jgi:CDP-6-deoxy-D-xylo-4-hexulose-3-dehydrase